MNIYETIIISVFLFMFYSWYTKKRHDKLFIFGAIIVFFLISLRGIDVGGDTYNYIQYFQGKKSIYGYLWDNYNDQIVETGYVLINRFIRIFSHSPFIFIFFISIITFIPFLFLIYKYNKGNKFLSLFIFMTMWQLMACMMTSLRQNCAISIAIIVIIIIKEKIIKQKLYLYFFVVLMGFISIICHSTMYVVIPLLLICYFVKFSKKTAIITLLSCLAISLIIDNFAKNAFDVFNAYASAFTEADNMTRYYQNDNYALTENVNFNAIAPHALFTICYIFLCNKDDMKTYQVKCLIIAESIYILGMTFPLVFRVVLGLFLIGVSYSPYYFRNTGNRRLVIANVFIYVFCFFYIYLKFMSFINYDYSTFGGGGNLLPYTFIWE